MTSPAYHPKTIMWVRKMTDTELSAAAKECSDDAFALDCPRDEQVRLLTILDLMNDELVHRGLLAPDCDTCNDR